MAGTEELLDSIAAAIAQRVIAYLEQRAPQAPPPSTLPQAAEFLTTRQAAKLFALSVGTLEGWRSSGKGPATIKIGTAIRYSRVDLDAWLAKHRKKGAK